MNILVPLNNFREIYVMKSLLFCQGLKEFYLPFNDVADVSQLKWLNLQVRQQSWTIV